MKSKELVGSGLLVLTAMIWGSAFVAQKKGLDSLGPCGFNGIRSIIGTMALLPCIAFLDLLKGFQPSICGTQEPGEKTTLIKGGLCCGAILGFASLLQQLGISYTSVGKAGFITTLYIIIVPLLWLFAHKKVGFILWVCVMAAVCGMYLLCFKTGGGGINKGDLLVFASSILFSFHILVIDYFAPKTDGVRMSCIQFFISGIISLVLAFMFEKVSVAQMKSAILPLLYSGVMSSGVAYTLQIVAQKNVHPVVASLLMSLESVFAVLGGWVLLGERLNARELTGCCIIFAAVVLAQLPFGKKACA